MEVLKSYDYFSINENIKPTQSKRLHELFNFLLKQGFNILEDIPVSDIKTFQRI